MAVQNTVCRWRNRIIRSRWERSERAAQLPSRNYMRWHSPGRRAMQGPPEILRPCLCCFHDPSRNCRVISEFLPQIPVLAFLEPCPPANSHMDTIVQLFRYYINCQRPFEKFKKLPFLIHRQNPKAFSSFNWSLKIAKQVLVQRIKCWACFCKILAYHEKHVLQILKACMPLSAANSHTNFFNNFTESHCRYNQ